MDTKSNLDAIVKSAMEKISDKGNCRPCRAHLFQILVLTDNDGVEYNPQTLSDIAYDISEGDAIGDWEKKEERTLSPEETHAILLQIGNDGSFFPPNETNDEPPEGIELSDGGIIEPPDDDGTIRRRDIHGNTEDVLRPGDDRYEEFKALFQDNTQIGEISARAKFT